MSRLSNLNTRSLVFNIGKLLPVLKTNCQKIKNFSKSNNYLLEFRYSTKLSYVNFFIIFYYKSI